MIWLDRKYINLITGQVRNFKKKGDSLFNFSCPICGDSSLNRSKARGYLYMGDKGYRYHCHNCAVSYQFSVFLKNLNSDLYNQYIFDKFKDQNDAAGKKEKYYKDPEPYSDIIADKQQTLFDKLLDSLDSLPLNNKAVIYANDRKIPKDKFNLLYYVDCISKIGQLAPKYKERIVGIEPRLVIPFFSRRKKLIGVSCRSLDADAKLRYINVIINKDEPMIFGLDRVDVGENIYVTEGPIDSLFLPNSVAIGSSGLKKIGNHLPKNKMILIFDNQPRNKELIKEMNSAARRGYKVFIWPDKVEGKDLNDLILNGYTEDSLLEMINDNVHSNLKLLIEIKRWKEI